MKKAIARTNRKNKMKGKKTFKPGSITVNKYAYNNI